MVQVNRTVVVQAGPGQRLELDCPVRVTSPGLSYRWAGQDMQLGAEQNTELGAGPGLATLKYTAPALANTRLSLSLSLKLLCTVLWCSVGLVCTAEEVAGLAGRPCTFTVQVTPGQHSLTALYWLARWDVP